MTSYAERDTYGIYKEENGHKGPGPELLGANTLIGDYVHNAQNEHLGDIKEIMLDMRTGKVAYVVLCIGGMFTIGERLFAVPRSALKLDTVNNRFILGILKDCFENAPGFDSNDWPDMADLSWSDGIRTYYGTSDY